MGTTSTSAAPRIFAWLMIALAAAGCGDEVLCDSTPLVVIQAPTSVIAADLDSAAAGVQTDIHVRSTLLTTDEIELIVFDGAGGITTMVSQPVGEEGVTVFKGVTVPEPRTRLRAIGRSNCGRAVDDIELDVTGGLGCTLRVVSPDGPVTQDVAPGEVGSQIDIELEVGLACAGRTVTSTCGANSPAGVVSSTGRVQVRADICVSSPCELESMCTFRVTAPTGVETEVTHAITFDDQGPLVTVDIVDPEIECGGQVTAANDVNPTAPGVQIKARVIAATAENPELELTNTGGSVLIKPAVGDVEVTVEPGLNVLVGSAEDGKLNRGRSAACTVAYADMMVVVAAPAADGAVGLQDGSTASDELTFPLCGTVDRTGVDVKVRIDNGPPMAATVTGTSWCLTLTLKEAPHDLHVIATKGLAYGAQRFELAVDLKPPLPLTPSLITPNRQRVGLAWKAPLDNGGTIGGYLVKVSTTPLTADNFDVQGMVIPTGAGKAPGAVETAELFPARLGTQYWLGVVAIDKAGNRSPPTIAEPVSPAFEQLVPSVLPNPMQGELALGAAIAHGKLNDDSYDDLAIAAPTQDANGLTQSGAVYVYFGSPAGLPATPSLSILGVAANTRVGSGLATVRWKDDPASPMSPERDYLVIGAPGADGNAGRLYILPGGKGFPTGTIAVNSIGLQIGVSASAPGWFAGGRLGTALVAANIDGDNQLDLVASAVSAGGGTGGIVIIYDKITANVVLSTTDPSGLGGAAVEYMPDPLAQQGRAFGRYLHVVGPTLGAMDADDDLVVGYDDDASTTDNVIVVRGNGTGPATSGVTLRPFITGRDVRLEFTAADSDSEFGSQAVSVVDLNSDGSNELAISAYKSLSGAGQVLIVDGNTIGTGGVAKLDTPGVVLTTITGGAGARLGAVLIARDKHSIDDIDGDGERELLVGAVSGSAARLYTWFGTAIPPGPTTTASAAASIPGPAAFGLSSTQPRGPAGLGRWVGDINGDGLDDICWASPYDGTATNPDGLFALLFDGQS